MIKLDMKMDLFIDIDFKLNGKLVFYSQKRTKPHYSFLCLMWCKFNDDRMTKWEGV